MHTQLNEVINRARQAIQARTSGVAPVERPLRAEQTPPRVEPLDVDLQGFTPTLEPQPATYTVDPLSRFAAADEVAGKALKGLSKGAQRLWNVLHGAAVRLAAHKRYSAAVSHVTLALPHNGVAAALGYSVRYLHKLRHELETAGLLKAQGWAANVDGQHMHALTLWAVKVSPSNNTPRLTVEDFTAKWRDFKADLKSRNTVKHALSKKDTPNKDLREHESLSDLLVGWHVTGQYNFSPVISLGVSKKVCRLGAVQDAVNSLGLLADAAPHERRELIQQLAGWLSDSLHDRHSFRFWCSLLWSVAGKWEAVGALQAQLHRLLADLSEYDGILNPAAWFQSRCNSLAR